MNFEDERYIRIYTRKTVTRKLLGWEGRVVLDELLQEADRAGVIDLEGQDPADVAAVLTEIPVEVCRIGMARILERGVAVIDRGRLVFPRYIEAQEARQSDAQRQRESRAKRAALAEVSELNTETDTVTNRDVAKSQPVTETPVSVTRSHTESHGVTDGHSVLSRAVPSHAVPSCVVGASAPSPAEPAPKKPRGTKRLPADWEPKPEHERIAKDRGIDLTFELAKLRDHEFKQAHSDWDATARNWLRNAHPTTRVRPSQPSANNVTPLEALRRRAMGESQ